MTITLIKLSLPAEKTRVGAITITGDDVAFESSDELLKECLAELFEKGSKITILRGGSDNNGFFEYEELIGPMHPEYLGAIAEAMPEGYLVYELTEEYRKELQQHRKTA